MKILITLIAIAGIVLHAFFPTIQIDAITIVLFFMALLPWLSNLLEEIEFPGGWKVKFKKKEELTARAQRAGLSADLKPEDEQKYSFQSVAATDKNLALAGLRIELEKKLKEMSESAGINTGMQGVGRMLQTLSERSLIGWEERSVLNDMIGLLNSAVHGRKVDDDSFQWALETGVRMLKALDYKQFGDLRFRPLKPKSN